MLKEYLKVFPRLIRPCAEQLRRRSNLLSQAIEVGAATRIGAQKAAASANAKAIKPGKYTVILEPSAAIVLLENVFFSMDARSADEGRSFLSKPGGKTKLGEKMVDERVTNYSDPQHPQLPTSTWSQNGRPQEKIAWVDKRVMAPAANHTTVQGDCGRTKEYGFAGGKLLIMLIMLIYSIMGD